MRPLLASLSPASIMPCYWPVFRVCYVLPPAALPSVHYAHDTSLRTVCMNWCIPAGIEVHQTPLWTLQVLGLYPCHAVPMQWHAMSSYVNSQWDSQGAPREPHHTLREPAACVMCVCLPPMCSREYRAIMPCAPAHVVPCRGISGCTMHAQTSVQYSCMWQGSVVRTLLGGVGDMALVSTISHHQVSCAKCLKWWTDDQENLHY